MNISVKRWEHIFQLVIFLKDHNVKYEAPSVNFGNLCFSFSPKDHTPKNMLSSDNTFFMYDICRWHRRYNVFFAQTHSWCPIIGKTYTVVIFSHLWWIHISHRTQAFWATICCLIDVLWVMNHVAMIFIAQIPKRKVNINSTAQTLWIPVLFSIQDFTYMPL